MGVELGIIEGFYGKTWSWAERQQLISSLAPAGYGFYLYAPKADAFLRRRWREAHPAEQAQGLQAFASFCRGQDVRFGIGLSPYEIYLNFDAQAQADLQAKLAFFDRLGVQDLAILFDDMRGDLPDLAARQLKIMAWVRAHSQAQRLLLCPTYYSDDPVLDRVFGTRPAHYLETLGAELDPSIDIFWTGEEVCSRAFSLGHLQRVSQQLGRKPFLWDNYPVNDGMRMSQYLHLRGFTGRPASLADQISAHGVNPALQPTLTCIPALTLAASYAQGEAYAYRAAFATAAVQVLGPELGALLNDDLLTLQDIGLDCLAEKAPLLRERYLPFASQPGARELLDWLDGVYRVGPELVQTQ